jgi:hypothetical protein
MNRRAFCVSSAAAVAAAAAAVAERRTPHSAQDTAPVANWPAAIYKVIYDARFPRCRAFAAQAAAAGRMTAAIRGDVTALWYDDLRLQWGAGRGAIAGMTTMPSFFCLQQLAKGHWMRSTIGADHPCRDANTQLVSWVIGA